MLILRRPLRKSVVGLLAAAAIGAATAQALPAKNHALVIGIDRYPAAGGVSPLRFAVDDAKAVARVLGESNYEVVPLYANFARRDSILMELSRLATTAREEDSVLIYFAGHGVRRKLPRSSPVYWLTYDASPSLVDVGGIRISHLLDYVNEIPAGRKILILDHCFSAEVDVVQATLGSRAGEDPSVRTLYAYDEAAFKAQVESRVPAGLVVISAAKDKAYEFTELGHGIFTHHLLRAFSSSDADENDDNNVSVLELRKYIKAQVAPDAKKRGVIQDVLDIERGSDLDWPLVKLSRSTSGLRQMLSRLQQEGKLDVKVQARSLQALDAYDETVSKSVPLAREDQDLVDLLRKVNDLGSGAASSKNKVQIIQGWFDAKGVQ